MGDDDIVDEEELLWFKQIKETKENYKQVFEERRILKSEIDYIEKALETLRQTLVAEFQAFYDEKYFDEDETKPPQSARSSRYGAGLDQGVEDILDDGEKFELLQMEKLQNEDPESYNYYMAFKKTQKHKGRSNRRVGY